MWIRPNHQSSWTLHSSQTLETKFKDESFMGFLERLIEWVKKKKKKEKTIVSQASIGKIKGEDDSPIVCRSPAVEESYGTVHLSGGEGTGDCTWRSRHWASDCRNTWWLSKWSVARGWLFSIPKKKKKTEKQSRVYKEGVCTWVLKWWNREFTIFFPEIFPVAID